MKYVECVQNANKNVTPKETINAIKNAGFDGVFVQWYHKNWETSKEEQLNYCKKLNLKILFAHLGYTGINNLWLEGSAGEELVNGYLQDLDDCRKNDINLVIMHLCSKENPPKPNELGVNRLKTIVEYAEKLNIKIAFENNRTSGYLEYVFNNIKNENIGICLDSGHYHCHFKDDFNWNMFKDKILAVHIHDNNGEEDEHLLPFDGNLNFKNFFDKLKKTNYNGPLTLESCYRNDYLNISIDDFYKRSMERAKQIKY